MLRRRISIIGILFLSLLLSATCWSELYVGIGVGPQWASFNQHATITRYLTFNVKDDTQLSGVGVFGTIFAGYGLNYKIFYLGAEVNGDLSSTDFRSDNKEFSHQTFAYTRYRMRNSFGVSALPGVLITDSTLLYGRFGYANGNLRVYTTDPSLANINRHLSGFRYGVGLNHVLTQQLSMRVEYSHVSYENTRMHVFEPFGAVAKNTRIRPDTGEVEFGLVYHFNFC